MIPLRMACRHTALSGRFTTSKYKVVPTRSFSSQPARFDVSFSDFQDVTSSSDHPTFLDQIFRLLKATRRVGRLRELTPPPLNVKLCFPSSIVVAPGISLGP